MYCLNRWVDFRIEEIVVYDSSELIKRGDKLRFVDVDLSEIGDEERHKLELAREDIEGCVTERKVKEWEKRSKKSGAPKLPLWIIPAGALDQFPGPVIKFMELELSTS